MMIKCKLTFFLVSFSVISNINAQTIEECCLGANNSGNGPELITWGDFECFPVSSNEATFEASCGSNEITVDPGFGVGTGCVGDDNFSIINPQVTTSCFGGGSNFSSPVVDPNGVTIGPGNRSLFVNGGNADEIFCFSVPTETCRDYCFSAYVYTDCCAAGAPSAVGYTADGVSLIDPVIVQAGTGWVGSAATFVGTGGNVILCVIDAEPAAAGNDWVLDNVSTYAINRLFDINPIVDFEMCAISETTDVGITSCVPDAGPYTVNATTNNGNVSVNSPIIVNTLANFPAALTIIGQTIGNTDINIEITDSNGCIADDYTFNVNNLGRPPEIICPNNLTVQCDSDVTPSFQNETQFLSAGGTINHGCGNVTFQCVSETIE